MRENIGIALLAAIVLWLVAWSIKELVKERKTRRRFDKQARQVIERTRRKQEIGEE